MNKELLHNNKKIFYRVSGTGNPVLLIHGFGEDGEVWRNQTVFLKDKCQLIIPDLPGSGQPQPIDDMSMEGIAEVIHSIIHKENLDRCKVIGHSMGGYITLALVEKYWNHLDAFGLFHSSAFADSEEKKAVRQKGIEHINTNGAAEFLKTMIPNLFSQQTRDEKPELIDEQLAFSHNFLPESLVSYYKAMIQRPDRTEILRKAAMPVLFIMGKYDNAIPLEDCLQQCHLPEKSYIHILQQSGHMGMLEEPEKCNILLESFLLESGT